jgi:hypothetical protein
MVQWLLFVLTAASAATIGTTSDTSTQDGIFDKEQHETLSARWLRGGLEHGSHSHGNLRHAAGVRREHSKIPFYFSVTKQGCHVWLSKENSALLMESNEMPLDAFRQAVLSQIPRAAAELMQLDPETQNLRILR